MKQGGRSWERHLILIAMAAQPQNRSASDAPEVMTLYGQSMTRFGGIFTLGILGIVPFGVASLAITTRFLEPADFGRLAVLFAIAALITMMSGAGFLQGTFLATYGIGDDDGDGGADAFTEEPTEGAEYAHPEQRSAERHRLLGSGFIFVIASASALCGLVALVALGLGAFAISAQWSLWLVLAASSAWTGGIWRFVHQVPRMERKAVRWAALQWLRPGLVVLFSILALMAGWGISGVLIATTVGTLASIGIGYLVSRRSFSYELRKGDARMIWDRGKKWVPLIFTVALQQNASILLLGALATPTSVGLFQVANRIAQFPSYFADGFVTAWPPLERSMISLAAQERKGRNPARASVFTLLALCTVGLLVVVCISAPVLIHIAAPSYSSAAGLIPVVAMSYAFHTGFRGVFRAVSFPYRRYWFTLLHLVWILPFAGLAGLLMPLNASYGVAIAQTAAWFVVTAIFVARDRRTEEPTPFEWRRLGLVFVCGAASVAVVGLVPASTEFRVGLACASLVLFPALLMLTGAIKRGDLAPIVSILRGLLPHSRAETRRRLARVPERDRDAVVLIGCRSVAPEEAAALLGVSSPVASARLTRGLRHMTGERDRTPNDHLIGVYLAHDGTTIEKDAWAIYLKNLGVDTLQLHLLDEAYKRVTRLGSESVSTGSAPA
jgi:O-antigen/teichoic acid export membrane protein